MIRLAALLCLVAPAAQAAVTTYDCRISTVCVFDEGCYIMDEPNPMLLTLGADGMGEVTLERRSGTLTALGETEGAVSFLAREGTRSLALITIHPYGTVTVSVQDMTAPRESVMMSGGCLWPR